MIRAKSWASTYSIRHGVHCVIRIEAPMYGVRFGDGRLSADQAQDVADEIKANTPLPEDCPRFADVLCYRLLDDYVDQYGVHPEEDTLP